MSRIISPNNPVRRVLFPAEDNAVANSENTQNNIREFYAKEAELMKKKWNYDIINDRPLEGKGRVTWDYNENGQLVGVVNDSSLVEEGDDVPSEEKEAEGSETESIRAQNDNTPNATPLKKENPPFVRKRPKDVEDDRLKDSSAKKSLESSLT